MRGEGRITKKLVEVLDGQEQLAFSQIIDGLNFPIATERKNSVRFKQVEAPDPRQSKLLK